MEACSPCGQPGEKYRTQNHECQKCGALVKHRTHLHYLLKQCEAGDESNDYVLDFFENFGKMFETRRYHAMSDVRHIRKEVSESMAALRYLEPHILAAQRPLVVDTCCGVGLSTALLAAAFQTVASIIGVELNSSLFSQSHYFLPPGEFDDDLQGLGCTKNTVVPLPNEICACDVHEFAPELSRRMEVTQADHVSVLGVHACCLLGLGAIDLFAEAIANPVVASASLLLIPCCVPNSKVCSCAPSAAAAGVDPYGRWCDMLVAEAEAMGGPGTHSAWKRDPLILSQRNGVVSATWSRVAAESGRTPDALIPALGITSPAMARSTMTAERAFLMRRRLLKEACAPIKDGLSRKQRRAQRLLQAQNQECEEVPGPVLCGMGRRERRAQQQQKWAELGAEAFSVPAV